MSDTPPKSSPTEAESVLPKFRSQALEALGSPEQLDQLIRVVPPRAWIILSGFYVLLISLIIWGIFGSIPTRVTGKGVLLAENGSVYNAVAPPGGGRVAEILVQSGQIVNKGDVIAHLDRPDLIAKLKVEQQYLANLKQEQTDLIAISARELTDRHNDIANQKASVEASLKDETNNFQQIAPQLQVLEDSYKKGLISWLDLSNVRQNYYSTADRIKQLQIQLTQLETQEDDFKDLWRQRLKDKDLLILGEEVKLNNLTADMEVSRAVQSPAEGIIISVNTAIGKIVPDGASIATITSLGQGLDALIFMLPHEGERVAPGMNGLVTPVTVESEEYGSMRGTVIAVSAFPEATETINALFHNDALTKQFVEAGAPTAIRIRIKRNPHTYSGYTWSSSKGPDKTFSPGTLAEARITVREQPPLSLIIPAFKKLLGIS